MKRFLRSKRLRSLLFIRKKPSQAEVCVKAFRKSENRLEALKMIVSELEQHEIQVVKDWLN
jgi:two-component sensor histidine kinase